MRSVLTLDGTAYPNLHVVSLKRSFAVLDGDNAGRVMTGAMVRDIIGTFYNYSVELDPVGTDPAEYDRFYEAISAPVDSHSLTVPYAQGTLTFDAYVANGDDELLTAYGQKNEWGNLTFNFVAMKPILNGVTVSHEKEGTYEFVATTNTRILFEQKKTYDGNGNVVWTPTCTITEN